MAVHESSTFDTIMNQGSTTRIVKQAIQCDKFNDFLLLSFY